LSLPSERSLAMAANNMELEGPERLRRTPLAQSSSVVALFSQWDKLIENLDMKGIGHIGDGPAELAVALEKKCVARHGWHHAGQLQMNWVVERLLNEVKFGVASKIVAAWHAVSRSGRWDVERCLLKDRLGQANAFLGQLREARNTRGQAMLSFLRELSLRQTTEACFAVWRNVVERTYHERVSQEVDTLRAGTVADRRQAEAHAAMLAEAKQTLAQQELVMIRMQDDMATVVATEAAFQSIAKDLELNAATARSRITELEGEVALTQAELTKACAESAAARQQLDEFIRVGAAAAATRVEDMRQLEEDSNALRTQLLAASQQIDAMRSELNGAASRHRETATILEGTIRERDMELKSLRQAVDELREMSPSEKLVGPFAPRLSPGAMQPGGLRGSSSLVSLPLLATSEARDALGMTACGRRMSQWR